MNVEVFTLKASVVVTFLHPQNSFVLANPATWIESCYGSQRVTIDHMLSTC